MPVAYVCCDAPTPCAIASQASGEISRDLVASVVVRAATSDGAKNTVIEIVETGTCVSDQCPADIDSKGLGKDPASWF